MFKQGGGDSPPCALTEVNTALNGLHSVLLELFADIGIDVHGSEYQQSSHVGVLRYFFSGGGVLSISL